MLLTGLRSTHHVIHFCAGEHAYSASRHCCYLHHTILLRALPILCLKHLLTVASLGCMFVLIAQKKQDKEGQTCSIVV